MRPILALLAVAAIAPATEASLRIGLTSLATDIDYDEGATGPGGFATQTGSSSWDTSRRLSVGLYLKGKDPVSPYVGFGLAFSGYDYKSGTLKERQSQAGIFVEPGLSFSVTPVFSIETGLILGAGSASYREEDVGYHFDVDGGTYREVGLVVRPVIAIDRILLFGEVGYLNNRTRFKDTDVSGFPGVRVNGDIKTSGVFYSLGIGLSF
jgi:hypothetical protein